MTRLSHFQNRICFAKFAALSLALSAPFTAHAETAAPVDFTTYHYGNARLGWNARETQLTPSTVRADNFGPRWKTKLDGGVYGATLVVNDLLVNGRKRRVVFAATERNAVYALDAERGNVLWTTRELAFPVSEVEFRGWWSRKVNGVLSTPVIDLKTQTLYVCGVTRRGLRQQFMVWALDIRTGNIRPNWPQTVRGSYAGKTFVAGEVMQRGALSLVNGRLIVPFGSRGDIPPWRGWAFAFDTRNPRATPLAFCTAPVADGGGIWSAAGITSDERGNLFIVSGNGEVDVFKGGNHVAQSVLRVTIGADGFRFSKKPADYYTPSNFQHLNNQDEGMGGASAMILPDQSNSSTRRLLFVGGKDGLGYLLNRDNLGGLGGELEKPRLYGLPTTVYQEGIRATSAYFDAGAAGRFLYVPGDQTGTENRGLVALRLTSAGATAPTRTQQQWTLKTALERPSAPVVTSNGSQDGIVWVMETRDVPGAVLRAYEALSGREIYHSDSAPQDKRLPAAARFISPVVANGEVFVSTTEGVASYGLGAQTPQANSTTSSTRSSSQP